MTCALTHRGPDGEGLWFSEDGRAVLGHRRLSVIDLEGGAQPMTGGDAGCAITFNGEIYNYLELRRDLERRGIRLRTQSDTEVLLRLYELEGEACLERCTGMFALAIWDGRRGRLLLARDRLGKKPLYFAQEQGALHFASTLASLRMGLSTTREIDVRALDDFLSLGFVPSPRTIFEGVEKLPAACSLSIEGGERRLRRFWSAASADSPVARDRAPADALEAVLQQAVSLRLRSDVPLGVFLSGGVDSSLVTALAARELTGLQTFSIAFGEADFDENRYAEQVSRHLGTEHRAFTIREGLLELLPSLVRHAGEPFADASALPLWALSREARQHVTVALGGDGGDEGFAGYPWYRLHRRLERWRSWMPPSLPRSASRALRGIPGSIAGILAVAGRMERAFSVLAQPTAALRYGALRVHTTDSDIRSWYGKALDDARRANLTAQYRIAAEYAESSGDVLRRMRVADLTIHLADGLMPKSDIASMAHGLELRSPLLDHEVVAFGLSLEADQLEDERGGKLPLRRLLERYVPRRLTDRPKQGFVVPLIRWFREGLRGRVEGLSRSEVLAAHEWFDPRGLDRLVTEHSAAMRDHTQRLFNLIVLEEWLRQA